MQTLKTTWTGIRPMLMHNGLLADPTNPYARRIKDICRKGSKKLTDADYEERDRVEWEGSLYWDDTDGLVVTSDAIERCIQLGAQKSRIGKDVQAAVFCTTPHVDLEYQGPKSKAELYKFGLEHPNTFILRKGVAVQKNRVIRIRPMIPTGWRLQIELEYDETILNRKSLEKAIVDSGALIGLGDWRPKFGRFIPEFVA